MQRWGAGARGCKSPHPRQQPPQPPTRPPAHRAHPPVCPKSTSICVIARTRLLSTMSPVRSFCGTRRSRAEQARTGRQMRARVRGQGASKCCRYPVVVLLTFCCLRVCAVASSPGQSRPQPQPPYNPPWPTHTQRTCTLSSSMSSRRWQMRRLRTTTSRHRSRPSWCTVVLFCSRRQGGQEAGQAGAVRGQLAAAWLASQTGRSSTLSHH